MEILLQTLVVEVEGLLKQENLHQLAEEVAMVYHHLLLDLQ
jgi:hypothetical protein